MDRGGRAGAGDGMGTADNDVCIVGFARTPLGAYGGSLASLDALALGAHAIKSAVERAGIDASAVEEVFMGNVLAAGLGQNPARQAALKAGLSESVPATTVNKVCSSGMKALMFASQSIMLGMRDVVVAGGMESMSNAPYLVDKHRFGAKMGHQQLTDSMITDGLWDAKTDQHMGVCAELCATEHEITREDQDKFAAESYRRVIAASKRDGGFGAEIAPVAIPNRRGPDTLVTLDEEAQKQSASAATDTEPIPKNLSKLRTVFKKEGGTVTAGNASPLSDGGAALVLCSRRVATKLGLRIRAIVRSFDDAAKEPERFTTAPSLAIPRAIERAGLTKDDIGFYEINEAFSAVGVANMKILDLSPDIVNVRGGAVAMGHPLGCSGARIIVTLIGILQEKKARYGCAGICNGGGGASAMVIESEM